MLDNKNEAYELQTPLNEKEYDMQSDQGIKSGTARDAADMMRLGKKQEFKRNFHAFSMLGLSSVLYAHIYPTPDHGIANQAQAWQHGKH